MPRRMGGKVRLDGRVIADYARSLMSGTYAARLGAVPFVDLAATHEPIRERFLEEVERLLVSGAFTNGPQVREFEEAFAGYCHVEHCVGIASGLDALRLALVALGLEPGDEVVVPAHTFIATWEAVTQAGGVPLPADVRLTDYNLDPAAVDGVVGPRTRFLMPVHLYGQLADMRALTAVADRHQLTVVEDACQAHGAERDGLRAGSAGAAAAFSFYPGKNLGAVGDAGAAVTDDEELTSRLHALREHGQVRKYEHETVGYTARLDTIQAIALLLKLPLLDEWNEERRRIAAFYQEALANVGDLRLPQVAGGSSPVWHLFVVRTARPGGLADFLAERQIGTGRHYPQPPHRSPAYRMLGYAEGEFPVTERLAEELLSLPIFPGMSEGQQEAVVEAVKAYFDG